MRLKLSAFLLIIVFVTGLCGAGWDWGFGEKRRGFKWNRDNAMAKEGRVGYSGMIWYYKKNVSPKMGPQCPMLPTCSTYTLYSMNRYGFFIGLIMGVERMYIRENRGSLSNEQMYEKVYINNFGRFYDPPEANYVFGKKDWRYYSYFFYSFLFEPTVEGR